MKSRPFDNMQHQVKKLQRIGKVIDLNSFYNIEMCGDRIRLQAKYTSDLAAKLLTYMPLQINEMGYAQGEKHNVRIVLT